MAGDAPHALCSVCQQARREWFRESKRHKLIFIIILRPLFIHYSGMVYTDSTKTMMGENAADSVESKAETPCGLSRHCMQTATDPSWLQHSAWQGQPAGGSGHIPGGSGCHEEKRHITALWAELAALSRKTIFTSKSVWQIMGSLHLGIHLTGIKKKVGLSLQGKQLTLFVGNDKLWIFKLKLEFWETCTHCQESDSFPMLSWFFWWDQWWY